MCTQFSYERSVPQKEGTMYDKARQEGDQLRLEYKVWIMRVRASVDQEGTSLVISNEP